jgi:hypothetical protein
VKARRSREAAARWAGEKARAKFEAAFIKNDTRFNERISKSI